MLFTPAVPLRTVKYVPGHDHWHPDLPPVAEVIAGGSVRLHCEGRGILCGPVGVVGAEPGDLVMVEILGIGRADGHHAAGGHPGILGCAPSHAMLRNAEGTPPGHPEPVRARCRALTPRAQILIPVHVEAARISAGDLHFPEHGRCGTRDGWVDLRVHLTKRGVRRFRITEPVVMPVTTSSLDATVAGITPYVA